MEFTVTIVAGVDPRFDGLLMVCVSHLSWVWSLVGLDFLGGFVSEELLSEGNFEREIS